MHRANAVDGRGTGPFHASAPVAGIIFAHEVILRHYSLRAFAPITVAVTAGYVIATVVFERQPLFRVEDVSMAYAHEFPGFILIGIAGAFVAVLYMRAILFSSRIARRLAIPEYLKPMLAGAVLGSIAIWIPDILGIGKETLRFAVIDRAFEPGELAILLVAKIAATALCIGFGFAGGVFSPTLLVGILFGALAGNGAELLLSGLRSEIAIYAICGMVAVTSAVIGAPLTTILIVFELTHNYDLTMAAMVSVVFSSLISYGVPRQDLYRLLSTERGLRLAFERLDSIREHIVWWTDTARPVELLAEREVVLASQYNGRLFDAAVVQGHPIEIIWDAQVYELGAWGIPKGTPRLDDALRFIRFATGRGHSRIRRST